MENGPTDTTSQQPPLLPVSSGAGSIGAVAPELSKYILSDEDYIDAVIEKLNGIYSVYEVRSGKLYKTVKYDSDRAFPQPAIIWFERKLRNLLNKGTYLSQFSRDDFLLEARSIALSFAEELYINSDELNITPEQFRELANLYVNSLSFAIRRAVGESEKNFLSRTSAESTQIVKTSVEDKRPSLKKLLFG